MDLEQLFLMLAPILEALSGQYGALAQVLSWLVASSAIVKTVETSAKAIVALTPTDKDDAFLSKVLGSKAYSWVNKVFGLLLNIKLPSKQ